MKRHNFLVVVCLASLVFAAGCSASPEDDESALGSALSASIAPNSIAPNSIAPNSISPGMLGGAALAMGSLDASVMSAIQDPSASGASARLLLRYTVGCALDTTQSMSFTWVDADNVSHDETYSGVLGLAPDWASGPLAADGQTWVSACLIARVNYFGVTVNVSLRGPMAGLDASESELAAYTKEEGAFWGNLFTTTPTAYACHNVPDTDHSRAAYRVCATGYVDSSGAMQSCGIIERLGSCSSTCGQLDSAGYYASCSDGAGPSSSSVVTVFLE